MVKNNITEREYEKSYRQINRRSVRFSKRYLLLSVVIVLILVCIKYKFY